MDLVSPSSAMSGRGEEADGGASEANEPCSMAPVEQEYEFVESDPKGSGDCDSSKSEEKSGRGSEEPVHPDLGLLPEELVKRADSSPELARKLLGCRLELKWSSGKWYRGTICEYNETKRKWKVMYDDGDLRWYYLPEMVYRFICEEDEWIQL